MSLTADGALSNVQPISTESRRAITPSKLFTRQTTPQRSNSAPRSNSNNRGRFVNDINVDPRIIRTGPPRPISIRRQRRWENKNLFGLEDFSRSKEERMLEALENDVGTEGIPFEVSWRSTFTELFKSKNQQVLHDFLSCKDVVLPSQKVSHVPKDVTSLNDWEVAEITWVKVEKRIRAAILRSFSSSEVIRHFLTGLERVILHFAHTQEVLATEHLCDEFKNKLAQPMTVDKAGNLVIPLHDSAFLRLLVQGVAQFYVLQSNSVRAKGNVHKCCLVKPPRCAPPSSSASATETATARDGSGKATRRASAASPPLAQTGHTQAEDDDATAPSDEVKQEEEEIGEVEVAAASVVKEAAAPVAVPVAGLLQLGFGRVGAPSTDTAAIPGTASEYTRSGRSWQHKFASLTISDAEAIKTSCTSSVADSASLAEGLGSALSSAASAITALCTGQAQIPPVESPAPAFASPGNPRLCSLTADSYDCVTLGDAHHEPGVMVSPPSSTPQSRTGSVRQLSPAGSDHEEYVVIPSPSAGPP